MIRLKKKAAAAPKEDEHSALGLTRTKEAVMKAVGEAAKMPVDERRKKLRQLRLKWHPDKHDVLKELAEEVTKLINQAVDEIGGEEEQEAKD